MTRPVRVGNMKASEVRQSFAERFRLAGKAWAHAKMQADIIEEMKGPRLEQIKTKLYEDMIAKGEKAPPEAKLERLAKSSPEWEQYIRGMCHARELANDAWVERKAVEIEESEAVDKNANYRTERRMHERS